MGDRTSGPQCTTQLGIDWIDEGTMCRSQSSSPVLLGRGASSDPIVRPSDLISYHYSPHKDPSSNDPDDVTIEVEVRGMFFKTTKTIHREGLYARLVTTFNPVTLAFTQRLYRRDDFQNPGWIDVTKEASREGLLSVEWNMPTLESDADKVRKIEGPGLMWGFAPFIARGIQQAYLKDQTLGIRDPYLRFMASTKQQEFRAIDEVNQRLEEFALTSVVPEIPGAVGSLKAATMGAEWFRAVRLFAQSTAKPPAKGAISRLFAWLFKGREAIEEATSKIVLTEQTVVLAVIKDGKILARSPLNSMLSHEEFLLREFGTTVLEGPLKGAEVVTIGKLDGKIMALRSSNVHGAALPASQAAIDAARKVFR